MEGERGRGWLLVGCLGILGSVAMAVFLIDAYLRHMASGDRVVAALGVVFLFILFALLPSTGVAILLGTVPGRPVLPAPSLTPDPLRPRIALLFRAGAICLLGFAGGYCAFELLPSAGNSYQGVIDPSFFSALCMGVLLAFVGLLWGCAAVVVRPGAAVHAPWFVAVLLATAVFHGAVVVSLTMHTGGATPSFALIAQNFGWAVPSMALVVAALRTLWLIRGPRADGSSPGP